MSLHLYQRPARGSAHLADLTPMAAGWRRSSRAVGGFWDGEFSTANLTRAEMIDFFDSYLGCAVTELGPGGMVAWEGLVWEMRLMLDGVEYQRTLAGEWWHNRIECYYQDTVGGRQVLTWAENTDASAEYGQMEHILSLAGATTAAATALRDRHLLEYAWPRSRMVGGLAMGRKRRAEDSLRVTCAGFWATLGWRHLATTTTAAANVQVGTLVAASQFVTAGRVEINGLSVLVDGSNVPVRLNDALEDIIEQGDATPAVWQGGVYAGRKFVYESAPTSAAYILRDGYLLDLSGGEVDPALLLPGFLLRNAGAAPVAQPPGTSSVWDDPRIAYVDEVEYGPDGLKLHLYGTEESLAVLSAQMGVSL